jgi:hypothetical protein
MKNKKILLCIGILTLLVISTGCKSVATLAVKSNEVVTIDATSKIDPYDYLKDVDEGADVEYSITDGTMIITVSKDDETKTFEVPIEIEEPNVSIDENIVVDKYVGYNIEDYIHEDEGVSHTTSFDEETGNLSVTFTKGEWTTTLDSKVIVEDSTPKEVFPKVYSCYDNVDGRSIQKTLYEDGTFDWVSESGATTNGTWTYDDNGTFYFDYVDVTDKTATGNYEGFSEFVGYTQDGSASSYVCTLVKEGN